MHIVRPVRHIAAALLTAGALALAGCSTTGSAGDAPAAEQSEPAATPEAPETTQAPERALDIEAVASVLAGYTPGGRKATTDEFMDPDNPVVNTCVKAIVTKDDMDVVEQFYGSRMDNPVWIAVGAADSKDAVTPFVDTMFSHMRSCDAKPPNDMIDVSSHDKGETTVAGESVPWVTIKAGTPAGDFYDSTVGFTVDNMIVGVTASSKDPAEAQKLAAQYASEVAELLAKD